MNKTLMVSGSYACMLNSGYSRRINEICTNRLRLSWKLYNRVSTYAWVHLRICYLAGQNYLTRADKVCLMIDWVVYVCCICFILYS